MPNNFDISISLPTFYKKNEISSSESKTPTSNTPTTQEEIKPNQIPSGINKVRKKMIRGIVKHDAL